jgi:RNA recognition motif-containing protein
LAKPYASGKRDREARRDQKNQDKQARLQRNRELRARGIDPMIGESTAPAQEVALEDISPSGTAPRATGRRSMPMRLFVGGLSWETTDADLRAAFEKLGEVSEAVVILDRATGRSRGFGFVTYVDAADGQRATRELHGTELDGRPIKVSTAESR